MQFYSDFVESVSCLTKPFKAITIASTIYPLVSIIWDLTVCKHIHLQQFLDKFNSLNGTEYSLVIVQWLMK